MTPYAAGTRRLGLGASTTLGWRQHPQVNTIRRVLGDYSHVMVIGDNDEAGRKCTAKLAAAGLAPHVVFSPLDGEDARDLRNRLGPTGFTSLINDALTEKEPEK